MTPADLEILVQQGGGHAKPERCGDGFFRRQGVVAWEMTIPDEPRSSRRRYRLTPVGREYLKRIGDAR